MKVLMNLYLIYLQKMSSLTSIVSIQIINKQFILLIDALVVVELA